MRDKGHINMEGSKYCLQFKNALTEAVQVEDNTRNRLLRSVVNVKNFMQARGTISKIKIKSNKKMIVAPD